MKLLNERYDYGVQFTLLSVDEGITGYRDDSLEVNLLLHLQWLSLSAMRSQLALG